METNLHQHVPPATRRGVHRLAEVQPAEQDRVADAALDRVVRPPGPEIAQQRRADRHQLVEKNEVAHGVAHRPHPTEHKHGDGVIHQDQPARTVCQPLGNQYGSRRIAAG